ncbi:hypothetical protein BDP81DRAFT_165521 [Colletotrichum phormii]|uniref:Uncharacterized protein n=1 Tax=Colletotrichum phormii TaxID=359342 RepID=A0AAI9ZYK7_9PEZI|nr:uncharacterized protein BDP81DRAFT_165521 [Colletotrichum phormii]KAK1640573.1 hypothetical protein BDP81DRAFT_165521 [Colletotrichum phormii]
MTDLDADLPKSCDPAKAAKSSGRKNMCLSNKARRCQLRPSFRRTVLIPLTGQNPDRSRREICSACISSSLMAFLEPKKELRRGSSERKDLKDGSDCYHVSRKRGAGVLDPPKPSNPGSILKGECSPSRVVRMRPWQRKKTGFGRQNGILPRQQRVGSNAACGEAGTPKTMCKSAWAWGQCIAELLSVLPSTQRHVP